MSSHTTIPVVDIGAITNDLSSGTFTLNSNWVRIAEQLEHSLVTVGFVHLVNHGIDRQVVSSAFEQSKSFFLLPDDIKLKYLKCASVVNGVKEFHGYAPASKEILSPGVTAELRESFDIDRKVVAGDKYPNGHVPGFQGALTALEAQCRHLITKILKLLAVALKLDDIDFFVRASKSIEDPNLPTYTAFRSNYYPPISMNDDTTPGLHDTDVGSVVRCGEHTDYGIITLLFQDAIGGLEIKPGSQYGAEWIHVPPIPDTVLLNTGDMLEFWSGGKFPATWHRVRVPETVFQRRMHRQSIVYFVFPDDDAKISSLIAGPGEKEEISAYVYATDRISKSYKY